MEPVQRSTAAQILTTVQYSVMRDQLRVAQENMVPLMSAAIPPAASISINGVTQVAAARPAPSHRVDVRA